ncbi:response regulator [Paenibacillus sp. PAMC21692]|uniref:response regulator n=1 Tax=Paenibacillus sp. PAMC21692 TaxID=2762320 RepID=UPI00164D905A|nr:response regulator [Paenibacillus sp. PAMC21692]QNK57958.1 response regulator [Paenibacillus sp. PAMC21692]
MLKVLIVEDEKIARIAMQMIIPWEEHGFRLLDAASDGRKALLAVEKDTPDILFTDLQMPKMNGIELIRALKEREFAGKIIVLSNYDDFEFVRTALTMGVMDYLLKLTLQPAALIGLLNRAKEELFREKKQLEQALKSEIAKRENLNFLKTNALRKMLLENDDDTKTALAEAERMGVGLRDVPRLPMYIVIDGYAKALSTGKLKDTQLLSYAVVNIVKDVLNGQGHTEIVELSRKELFISVFQLEGHIADEAFQANDRLSRTIAKMLRQYLELQVSIVHGQLCMTLSELRDTFAECREAAEFRFYDGEGVIMDARTAVRSLGTWKRGAYSQMLRDIKTVVDRGDASQGRIWFEGVMLEAKRGRAHPREVKLYIRTLFEELESLAVEGDEQLAAECNAWQSQVSEAETFEQCFAIAIAFMERITNGLSSLKGRSYRKEIKQAIDFVQSNLSQKITLGRAAREVNMNEAYFSRLFKSETGVNFAQFIIERKMEKAYELLLDPDARVKDVAVAVGIDDPFYFNKLMKKHFGRNPSEIMKQARGKDK